MPPQRSFAIFLLSALLLAATPVGAAEKVVLQPRWDHQFQFAGYYAAKWQGFYADAGFDVEILSAFEPDGKYHDVMKEVAEGRADFGTGGADILTAIDQGAPLTVVASVFQRSPVAFYSRREDRIEAPADLTRFSVATRPNGIAIAELRAMLRADGIDPALVKLVPIRTGLGVRDLAGGIARAASGFTILAGWYARNNGLKLTTLSPQSYGVNFYGSALLPTKRWSKTNPIGFRPSPQPA